MRRVLCFLLLSVLLLSWLPAAPAEELTETQWLSYYSGCVFVGDSLTQQLRLYVLDQRKTDPDFMKDTRFLAAQSYFLYTASRMAVSAENSNLMFRGKEMALNSILEEMKPKRCIILLGVNDYIGEKPEKGIGYCERILDLAAKSSPDTQIIFESLTPVTRAFCRKKDYRVLWDQYNAALKEMCERRGAGYIDIATALKDEEGYLREDYSSDGLYHLKNAGLRLWLDALTDYAREQYELGRWSPEPQ